jgi:hypothetical protein
MTDDCMRLATQGQRRNRVQFLWICVQHVEKDALGTRSPGKKI